MLRRRASVHVPLRRGGLEGAVPRATLAASTGPVSAAALASCQVATSRQWPMRAPMGLLRRPRRAGRRVLRAHLVPEAIQVVLSVPDIVPRHVGLCSLFGGHDQVHAHGVAQVRGVHPGVGGTLPYTYTLRRYVVV